MKKYILATTLMFSLAVSLSAQTITDGLMMPRKTFCTGFLYGYDSWTGYWEGDHHRVNGNIGKITTQSLNWMGTYGINKKVNIIAMLPYVWTKASQGTLRGMEGVQDVTMAVKYNFFKTNIDSATFKAFAGVAYSIPLTNYSPDFLPLSIGVQSKRLAWRLTLNYATKMGLYVNASSAYTWRSNITLDRSTHPENGNLVQSNQLYMPNMFDLFVTVGYHKQAVQAELSYTQQNTLGGDDILPQEMPIASNRMNFSKVGGLVMYYLPWPKYLAVRATASYTVDGRNVGQSTTVMGGLMYTFFFTKSRDFKI
jgi:hypothetical protein